MGDSLVLSIVGLPYSGVRPQGGDIIRQLRGERCVLVRAEDALPCHAIPYSRRRRSDGAQRCHPCVRDPSGRHQLGEAKGACWRRASSSGWTRNNSTQSGERLHTVPRVSPKLPAAGCVFRVSRYRPLSALGEAGACEACLGGARASRELCLHPTRGIPEATRQERLIEASRTSRGLGRPMASHHTGRGACRRHSMNRHITSTMPALAAHGRRHSCQQYTEPSQATP